MGAVDDLGMKGHHIVDLDAQGLAGDRVTVMLGDVETAVTARNLKIQRRRRIKAMLKGDLEAEVLDAKAPSPRPQKSCAGLGWGPAWSRPPKG